MTAKSLASWSNFRGWRTSWLKKVLLAEPLEAQNQGKNVCEHMFCGPGHVCAKTCVAAQSTCVNTCFAGQSILLMFLILFSFLCFFDALMV